MKTYLILSLFCHILLIGLLLYEKSNKTIVYNINVTYQNTPYYPAKNSNLFGTKSAYQLSKETNKGGDLPSLSDSAEITKERQDEESRPSHLKKEVLFKSYVDNIGESAIIPWFREVEKIVKIRKKFKDRTFITTVIVIINKIGEVVKVVIEASSGDTQLDLAVKNAFLGQKYARPPKDLIDKDGFGRIRWTFDMYLDVDLTKKGKFRIYRRES